jgi:L-ascorbate oxidase
MWSIHLDGHSFEVIAADFVPITPYTTSWLNIAIGQRFDVIVTANQPSGNYFLRAVTQTGCPSECDNNGLGDSYNGIVQYTDATLALPTSDFGNLTIADFAICADEPASSIVPYLTKTAGDADAFSAQASTLPAGNVALTQTSDDGAIFRWFLNGGSIDVNYTQPTLESLAQGNTALISNAAFLDNAADSWVYFVIQNQFFAGHPIHLHGHDFSLLGQLSGSPSPASAPTLFTAADVSSLNFNNPPRRDTAMLAGNGWTVIGFQTDNPGAWLMHCHIVWHVDGGLAMEFVERQADIDATSYVDSAFLNECSAYNTYQAANPAHSKTDGESGLRRRGWYEPEWMGRPESVVRRSESHEKRFLESHLKRGLGDSFKPRHMRR